MPSPIEKLLKFFKLEIERGYDNRAVVGGLDKFIPAWEQEARSTQISEDIILQVSQKLQEYPDLSPEQRASTISELSAILLAIQPTSVPIKKAEELRTKSENPVPPAKSFESTRPPESKRPNSNHPTNFSPSSTNAGLNAPLTVIQGIGPQSAKSLMGLGLYTLEDLLYYFPRRYDDYSQLKPINRLDYGEEVTIIATVQSASQRPIRGGISTMTEAVVSDGTGYLRLTWFNQPWIHTRLAPGTQLVLSGKIEMYLGRLVMNNPDWELLEQEHLHTNRIVPVYSLTARVTQKWLRRIMFQTVSYWASRIPDFLPKDVRKAAELVDLATALAQIHFPDSQNMLKAARSRLAFDEIFLLQLGVIRQKFNWQSVSAQVFETDDEWLDLQKSRLPYTLTGAQLKVLQELRSDLAAGRPMNRLLQGDVGSGKTVVAALAIAMVTRHDAQAALMAPTSILAEQHYSSLQKLLAPLDDPLAPLRPAEIRLLIGDTSENDKKDIRLGLEAGTVKLVIGTHALIEDPIAFKRLQLAIIDEQHRFGVAQRAALRAKGENPHLLVMTATPIPRSLALTVYGDLDLAVMDEMPVGRLPIETHVLSPRERERAYQLVRSQVKAGYQAFIIYPLIEKGENEETLAAVEEHALLQSNIFPQFKLGLLHGKMKPDEKDRIMSGFRDHEFDILVSTSVVEVGVDVPNATVMLIEGANRFGLAQLHQFRGRVGRGAVQSYCLLIPETEDSVENQRLAVMTETNDGFVLAERDLQQRGPGDFLGNRQAGFAELRLANLTDVRLIENARQQAQALFERDPALADSQNAALLKALRHFWGDGKGDIS